MTRVIFVDGPPPIGGPDDPRAVYMARLRAVTRRPGVWAEIASGSSGSINNTANALRTRSYWVPPGEWDFSVRTFRRGDGPIGRDAYAHATLYARFHGSDEPDRALTRPYRRDGDVVVDQWGRRICPECETNALINRRGKYPTICDECGEKMAATIPGPHGNANTYVKRGCRCRPCREAATARNYRYGARLREETKALKELARRAWKDGDSAAMREWRTFWGYGEET